MKRVSTRSITVLERSTRSRRRDSTNISTRSISTSSNGKVVKAITEVKIEMNGKRKKLQKSSVIKETIDIVKEDYVVDIKKIRCPWMKLSNPLYVDYHDNEWGKPIGLNVDNKNQKEKEEVDRTHFELISLEGAQAGLNWETILNKRENYRKAFDNFDPKLVSKYDANKIEQLMNDKGIVRNRLKIESVVHNAKMFLIVQEKHGSFNNYIWNFTPKPFTPILNHKERKAITDYPSKTELSDKISKEMKKLGFKFIGTTTIYAYLQASGIVNDHSHTCFCSKN